jgi:putative inorganic carbon (hco3(-)) transporter
MVYFLCLTVFFLPLYLWRFSLFGLPTNFLMLWVFFVWAIFTIYLIYKKQTVNFFLSIKNINKKLLFFIFLFVVSGVFSLFTNGIDIKKFGQFLVLFVQPISLFFIFKYTFEISPKSKELLLITYYLLLGLLGIYAIFQYLTLWGLPSQFWGNDVEPKRAIAFFSHPNFYALFSAPLLAFLIPDVFKNFKFTIFNFKIFFWIIGAMGLFLTLSRAGWLGLIVATIIYLIFYANNKIRKLASVVAIAIAIVLFSIPNFRYRLLLPFYGEKSAVSRMSLWTTGIKAIKESPLLGLGLNGFSNNWQRLNTDQGLTESHNFPHNIFLDFWVETGLLGLVSFIGIITLSIYKGLRSIPLFAKDTLDDATVIPLSIALFLICMLSQGLIDNPYFKNDLALLFWIILSLSI